jgi:hypothetical protein
MVNILEQEERCTIKRKSEGRNIFFGNLWQPSIPAIASVGDLQTMNDRRQNECVRNCQGANSASPFI